jgi:hypothetical protein
MPWFGWPGRQLSGKLSRTDALFGRTSSSGHPSDVVEQLRLVSTVQRLVRPCLSASEEATVSRLPRETNRTILSSGWRLHVVALLNAESDLSEGVHDFLYGARVEIAIRVSVADWLPGSPGVP